MFPRDDDGMYVEQDSVAEVTVEGWCGYWRRKNINKDLNEKKTFGTGDSRVIPNLSTGPARSTLASQFGMGYGACLLGMAECASHPRRTPIYTSTCLHLHNIHHYPITVIHLHTFLSFSPTEMSSMYAPMWSVQNYLPLSTNSLLLSRAPILSNSHLMNFFSVYHYIYILLPLNQQ